MNRALGALLVFFALPGPTYADAAKPVNAILLAAREGLPDSNFRNSVVLVMNNLGPAPAGVIVNRPTRLAVSQLFADDQRLAQLDDKVYFGGPVALTSVSFLFRAAAAPEDATHVVGDVYASTNPELLRKLLGRDKPMDGLRIFIGFSGWAPGQLEGEIARGDWKLLPAKPDAIFDGKPEHPWPERHPPAARSGS